MPEPETFPDNPVQDDRGLTTAAFAGARPADDGARPDQQSHLGRAMDERRAFGRDTQVDPSTSAASHPAALYSAEEAERLRDQWSGVQASFVDEPRRAVESADQLVAIALKHLAETFAKQRSSLEGQWDRGDEVSTEELRLVLQQYRSFFDRLLSI